MDSGLSLHPTMCNSNSGTKEKAPSGKEVVRGSYILLQGIRNTEVFLFFPCCLFFLIMNIHLLFIYAHYKNTKTSEYSIKKDLHLLILHCQFLSPQVNFFFK